MSSGADLFVVCKQCGSEVSPYITECPYCGHRLRRRAPKLPRARTGGRAPRTARRPLFGRLSTSPLAVRRRRRLLAREDRWAYTRPRATIALVAASAAAWIVWHAEPLAYIEMAVIGPLHGDWWKIFTSQFAYVDGLYAFLTIATIAIFGWLLERRHGPVVVLALFIGAGAAGALLATAVYQFPIVSGGNAGALALLMAWAAPDLVAARRRSYYEGDLLGAAAIAALLLAIPYARPEASWLAGGARARLSWPAVDRQGRLAGPAAPVRRGSKGAGMRTGVARIAGLVVAASVAPGAAAADSASAKVTLKLQANGETLAVGAPIVASSANFEVAGPGKVTCQDTSLNGKVEKNGTTLAATSVFEEITLAGEGEEGQCVSTYASPLHHTKVELISGLPLRLTLNPKGEAILKPVTAVSPGIEIGLRPLEPHKAGEAASCFYAKAAWTKGTYNHDGGALVVTMPATVFRLYNLSGLNCRGESAHVSATFTFSSSGFPVDSLIG